MGPFKSSSSRRRRTMVSLVCTDPRCARARPMGFAVSKPNTRCYWMRGADLQLSLPILSGPLAGDKGKRMKTRPRERRLFSWLGCAWKSFQERGLVSQRFQPVAPRRTNITQAMLYPRLIGPRRGRTISLVAHVTDGMQRRVQLSGSSPVALPCCCNVALNFAFVRVMTKRIT